METCVEKPRSQAASCDPLHVGAVDLKHLRRYTLGDAALEREVLDLFFQQLPKTIAALSGARSAQEWKVAAHTLKGSGRAVGAWRIARIAEQAEHAGGLPGAAVVEDVLCRLQEAVYEAHAFVEEVYPAQRPL